jgi:hypothetical protein
MPTSKSPVVVAGLPVLRFRNQWFAVVPRPFEPERQSEDVAWNQIQKQNLSWHSQERKVARLLANVASE